jgi:hypothetical protein
MDLPDDEHLTRSVTELGEPELLFRISRGRFLTKLGLGVLLLLYGVVANYLWWWVWGAGNLDHFVILLLFVLPLSGGALLWHMYRHRGLYVLVYPTGLLRLRRGEVDSFPWREVDHIRLKVQRSTGAEIDRGPDNSPVSCWLPAEVPTFQLWNAGLSVAREDGVEAHFGPALTDYTLLAAEVQKRTFAVLWPLIRERFLSGAPIPFGNLELSRAGVRHAGKFLRWSDVKELAIAQGKLSIKQGGKWLPWALLDVNTIPNPHILFALATEAQRTAFLDPLSQPRPGAKG